MRKILVILAILSIWPAGLMVDLDPFRAIRGSIGEYDHTLTRKQKAEAVKTKMMRGNDETIRTYP